MTHSIGLWLEPLLSYKRLPRIGLALPKPTVTVSFHSPPCRWVTTKSLSVSLNLKPWSGPSQ